MSNAPGTDAYFKKVIDFTFARHRLQFRVSQDLFSSHDVDVGTKFLLRSIVNAPHLRRPNAILDLGSGYGPIGLTLKRLDERADVHLTDRDALAVEYVKQNASINGLTNGLESYGSLGCDDVRRSRFDLIASNIPGKAGEPVLAELLLGARDHLAPGGHVAVVVVAPLEEFVNRVLRSSRDVEIVWRERRSGHVIFHYQFVENQAPVEADTRDALERGVYRRQRVEVTRPSETFSLDTVYGLPEFETPSYASEMLLDALESAQPPLIERALCFHPGQGHVPVAVWHRAKPTTIDLIDRDLLALRASRLNLGLNGCPMNRISLFHQVGLALQSPDQADLVVGVLRDEEGPAAISMRASQAALQLSPQGQMLVSGSSTAITRLAAVVQREKWLKITDRKRRLGRSLLAMRAVQERR